MDYFCPTTSSEAATMYRKQTRPRLIVIPRRDPSLQLSPKPIDVFDRLNALQQQQRSQRPAPKCKPGVSMPRPSSKQASKTPQRHQRLAKILKLAAKTPLRPPKPAPGTVSAIRPEGKISEAKRNGLCQGHQSCSTPVLKSLLEVPPRPAPPIQRRAPTHSPAFQGFKLRRLWKIKPGLYRLLEWDKATREVLLRDRNDVFSTRLPHGVMEPTGETEKTYLEIGRPEDRQHHRVSVQWLPMI